MSIYLLYFRVNGFIFLNLSNFRDFIIDLRRTALTQLIFYLVTVNTNFRVINLVFFCTLKIVS